MQCIWYINISEILNYHAIKEKNHTIFYIRFNVFKVEFTINVKKNRPFELIHINVNLNAI